MNKTIVAVLFFVTVSFAQTIIIRLENVKVEQTELYSMIGETADFIDSIKIINKEILVNSHNLHTGFYRLFAGKNRIDFIYDKEDIEIEADADNIKESLEVVKSESNKIYHDFIDLNEDYKTRSELLQMILSRYPEKDEYYNTTQEQFVSVQEEYLEFINVTSQVNPNSFIARYVRSARLPVVESEDPLEYLRSHALDFVNFYDDQLIYSDAFTSKTIEYLSYYRNPQLPMELLEKEFMSAIDSILSKARVNETVYRHLVEYLLEGFKQYGFDNVLNYITENYVIKDDLCLDVKLETALERRVNQIKIFKPGTTVPDISLPDSAGMISELSKIDAEQVLVVFYASWCPHCQKLLPEIYSHYKNQKEKKLEVLAVSIDSSAADWLTFISSNNLDWLNVSDLKGWEGKPVLDYYIYATPTMFLINNELKLLAMPKTVEEIRLIVN